MMGILKLELQQKIDAFRISLSYGKGNSSVLQCLSKDIDRYTDMQVQYCGLTLAVAL